MRAAATALPVSFKRGSNEYTLTDADGKTVAHFLFGSELLRDLRLRQMNEIVKAANAYPKLVEALRGVALRHVDGSLCFDGCVKAGLQEPSPFCARYQTILRDLGEGA